MSDWAQKRVSVTGWGVVQDARNVDAQLREGGHVFNHTVPHAPRPQFGRFSCICRRWRSLWAGEENGPGHTAVKGLCCLSGRPSVSPCWRSSAVLHPQHDHGGGRKCGSACVHFTRPCPCSPKL